MQGRVTNKQFKLLKFIYSFLLDTGYAPSIKEMREAMNVRSDQAIYDRIEVLRKLRLLDNTHGVARSYRVTTDGIALIQSGIFDPDLDSDNLLKRLKRVKNITFANYIEALEQENDHLEKRSRALKKIILVAINLLRGDQFKKLREKIDVETILDAGLNGFFEGSVR